MTGLQSQQTQLSDQFTSYVGNAGQKNLIYNSEFSNNGDGWDTINDTYFYVTNATWAEGSDRGLAIDTRGKGVGGWAYSNSKRVPITSDTRYSVSVDVINAEVAENGLGIVLQFFANETDPRISYATAWADPNSLNKTETLKIENQAPPSGARFANVAFVTSGKACSRWQHPMLVAAKTIGSYSPDSANSSQITQLQDAINLRVTKGNAISQINLEANRTLIQSSKLVLDAPTVVFTGNAFIPSAAIASLSADKITTGTLNAANLNVINLNASAIVTGTISGANLAINLNTGEVLFQKGSIKSTNGLLNINIDNGTFAQGDGVKGMLFTQGELYLSTSSMWASLMGGGDGAVPDYGKIGFNQAIVGQGLLIEGKHVLTLGIHKDNWPSTVIAAPPSLMMSDTGWFYLNGRGTLVQIDGGDEYEVNGFSSQPAIYLGTNIPTNNQGPQTRIVINAEYVHIRPVYEKTTSSSPNVFVASDGALVRSTSASKYKLNIKRDRSTELAERLLTLPTAHWLDKAAMQRFAAGEQTERPQSNFGLIAEDLAAVGLEDLVVRGVDGELEGIQYDRIAAALLPLLAQMKKEIDELKATA